MAKKTRKRSKGKSSSTNWLKTGLDADQLQKELKKSGGSADPEILFLRDGSIAEISVVSRPKNWVTFMQHYIGQKAGYKICGGEGCVYCDDGLGSSQRTMIGVFVNELFEAGNDQYKARKTKNGGYKYFILNKETTEDFLRRAKRRRGRLDDYPYTIERIGGGTDTKYDIERGDKRIKSSILKGWDKNIEKKLIKMKRREDETDDDDEDSSSDKMDSDFDYKDEKKSRRRRRKSSRRSRSR